jgi:hypothetical protein
MKRGVVTLWFIFSWLLVFSCKMEVEGDSGNNENSEGIDTYYLGNDSYWKNGIQHKLDMPEGFKYLHKTNMIVSNGKVFVIGSFEIDADNGGSHIQACYWQDGIFSAFSTDSNIIVNPDNVSVSNGTIYAFSHTGDWWAGKIQNKVEGETSRLYDLFVYNNTVYMAGYNFDNDMVPCYWMNNNKFILSTPKTYYTAKATGIFVDGGNVYCCGDRLGKIFYWINGQLFNIETPSENSYETNDIIVSSGKTFIFGTFSRAKEVGIYTPSYCYWEDGILKLLPKLYPYHGKSDPIVHNGKVYAFGYPSGKTIQAQYFVNGEEYPIDLAEVNARTYSMFIYNDDIYITGAYGEYQESVFCYWINWTKRVDFAYPVSYIFIDQKL